MKMNRREFIKAGSAGTILGVSSMGEAISKTQTSSKPQVEPGSGKIRRILAEDGIWWLGSDGHLSRRHLDRFAEEAAGAVDILAPVMAMPEICFYNTKVGELFGSNIKVFKGKNVGGMPARSHTFFWLQASALRSLIASGNDPAVVLPESCHKRGLRALANIKMNDTHHIYRDNFPYRSQFLLDNPQWHLPMPAGREKVEGTDWMVLDYSFPEVRNHRLGILQELIERYEWDGFFLNFVRAPYIFPEKLAEERAPIMNEFMRQVRELLIKTAQKRQKGRLDLAVLVPYQLQTCTKLGLDLGTWMKEGLVDMVCPSGVTWTEFSTKVDDFSNLAKGTSCGIYPCCQPYLDSRKITLYQSGKMTREMYRAVAHNAYTWGGAGLSFYNYVEGGPGGGHIYRFKEDIHDPTGEQSHRNGIDREMMKEVSNPEFVSRNDRHYVFLPGSSQNRHGLFDAVPRMHAIIIEPGEAGTRKVFPFRIAEDFRERGVRRLFRFKVVNQTFLDRIEVDLNGHAQPLEGFRREYHWYGISEWGMLEPYYQYECELTSPPGQKGDNELGVKLVKRNAALEEDGIRVQDLEVKVKYGA